MAERLDNGQTAAMSCNDRTCPEHYHAEDPIFTNSEARQRPRPTEQPSTGSGGQASDSTLEPKKDALVNEKRTDVELIYDPDDHGFRRIIRNFTPSYVYRIDAKSRQHETLSIANRGVCFTSAGSSSQ
jgi:hypothetical protein